ncbi:DUF6702 family protein [Aurantibacter sp.]|uniref:DUF6702 family protein n=1 Tax=Aurantibacter sp. TaxID=2807103 RepID=UPI0035C87541
MKLYQVLLVLISILFLSFTSFHKYYVSITEIEYVKEKESVQVITRIFIDDFQRLLQERYGDNLELDNNQDEAVIDRYIEKYLKSRIKINLNHAKKDLVFIGKEYDNDIVYCYFEIENIEEVNSFEIENTTLFDIFPEQKNVVRTSINNNNKTFVLIPENDKGMLNFN